MNTTNQPVVYAGAESNAPDSACFAVCMSTPCVFGWRYSTVARTGRPVSKGDDGFRTSDTQKHLATPSSPLISATCNPRSFRFLRDPLKTHAVDGLLPDGSGGAESIWLIRSNACCRSCRAVRLKIVIEQTSCFV